MSGTQGIPLTEVLERKLLKKHRARVDTEQNGKDFLYKNNVLSVDG